MKRSKITRRLVAIFAVIAIMASFGVVSVSAETDAVLTDGCALSGWKIQRDNQFMRYARSQLYVQDGVKHSGNAALRIYGASNNSHSGYLKKAIGGLDNSKTYKLGMYVKNVRTTQILSGSIYLQNEGSTKYLNGTNLWQTTYSDWTYLETDAISPTNRYINIRFVMADFQGNNLYIDDITLTEVGGDGTNLFANGDFEDVLIRDEGFTAPSANSATINWTNPNNADITSVHVTDVNDNVIDDGSLSTTANDSVSYTVSGLTTGVSYTYKIKAVATMKKYSGVYGSSSYDTEDITYTLPVTVIPQGGNFAGIPTYYGSKFAVGNDKVVVAFDDENGYSNGNSMRILSKLGTESGQYGSIEFNLSGFDSSKTYKYSYKYKCEGVAGYSGGRIYICESNYGAANNISVLDTSNTSWTSGIESTFTGQTNPIIQIWFDRKYGTVWIDDLVVREYDSASGKCVGDNLLSNGGFEPSNTNKIYSVNFTEAGGSITANITKYNSYESTAIIASYNSSGDLLEAAFVGPSTQGDLMQSAAPSISTRADIASVRAFVWMIEDGTYRAVGKAVSR